MTIGSQMQRDDWQTLSKNLCPNCSRKIFGFKKLMTACGEVYFVYYCGDCARDEQNYNFSRQQFACWERVIYRYTSLN